MPHFDSERPLRDLPRIFPSTSSCAPFTASQLDLHVPFPRALYTVRRLTPNCFTGPIPVFQSSFICTSPPSILAERALARDGPPIPPQRALPSFRATFSPVPSNRWRAAPASPTPYCARTAHRPGHLPLTNSPTASPINQSFIVPGSFTFCGLRC